MDKAVLASESFSHRGRHYYLDYRVAVNSRHFLSLACIDEKADGRRGSFLVFQDDLPCFIEALSSVFRSAAYEVKTAAYKGGLFRPPQPVNGIKSWEPAERPREKLMEQGRDAMSDAELLAMLIGSGLPGLTAIDLAKQVLALAGNDLRRLATFGAEDLMQIRGIGHARALSLISAMELAIRLAVREQPLHYLKLIPHG